MKTVGIIGHFGGEAPALDGQTIKTRELWAFLQTRPALALKRLDTAGMGVRLWRVPGEVSALAHLCDALILLTGANGYRILAPLAASAARERRIPVYEFVIGGQRQTLLARDAFLRRAAAQFANIFVESPTMVRAYERLGLSNCAYLPNFKAISVLQPPEVSPEPPFSACIFSRICREKGVEIAVKAVALANERTGGVWTLHAFGPVARGYAGRFARLQTRHPFLQYGGVFPYDRSGDALGGRQVLLFPTTYPGEGFPGTLIDAFCAGVPVIASEFHYNREIVRDGETGWLVPAGDAEAIARHLAAIAAQPQKLLPMARACVAQGAAYAPEKVLAEFVGLLEQR